jgi:two-component system repressor protein LuxO
MVDRQGQIVLIVEDISSLAIAYAGHLESAGITTACVASLAEAESYLVANRSSVAAILLDLQLPDGDGIAWLASHPEFLARHAVIVATADSSLGRAIEAMRLGSYDFLVKPLAPSRLVASIRSVLESREQQATNAAEFSDRALAAKAAGEFSLDGFIGDSTPMRTVYRQISQLAKSRATVFISGESGTGKEVCAQAIHNLGTRSSRSFVAVNCGAIPENLLESELFGHVKGAFTGAISDRVGAVQAAEGGTLFLDEICEMELKLQVKLLRFLQTGLVQRVGASRTESVDVRIVCATNRDPMVEVQAGRFREDLYYRLVVVPVHLPPLRARGQDIIALANHFLQRFGSEEGKRFAPLSGHTVQALLAQRWPGNVRELQNLMRRAAVMYDGPALPASFLAEFQLPFDNAPSPTKTPAAANELDAQHGFAAPPIAAANSMAASPPTGSDLSGMSDRRDWTEQIVGLSLLQIEQDAIQAAIVRHGYSIPAAARELGVSPSTIYRKQERWKAMTSSA